VSGPRSNAVEPSPAKVGDGATIDVPIVPSERGSVLTVTVVPRAGKTAIERLDSEALRVRIAAAPVDGAANEALLRVLADSFDVPRRQVSLLSGHRARRKRVLFANVAAMELQARLLATIGKTESRSAPSSR
jgi:uncharacterized protein (TIGR00251 family)